MHVLFSIYKITHLKGKPQGPLSFFSPIGSAAGAPSLLLTSSVPTVVAFVPFLAPVVPIVAVVPAAAMGSCCFDEGAAAVLAAPPEGPSSQAKLTFDTAL